MPPATTFSPDQPVAYTGVGSRETPPEVLALMRALGAAFARAQLVLRSGAADGADAAFETGARTVPDAPCDIFLPWRGFNGHDSELWRTDARAFDLAREVHPAWDRLSQAARKLHARNVHQCLGRTLDAPSQFLVCWTPDGCEEVAHRTRDTGGTGTAIVLAERLGIVRFNLARAGRKAALLRFLAEQGIFLDIAGARLLDEPPGAPPPGQSALF